MNVREFCLRSFLGVALLLGLLTAGVLAVSGQGPQLPMLARGRVQVNEVWKDGILVEAKIDGQTVASGLTFTKDGEKGRYSLVIWGDESDRVEFFGLGIMSEETSLIGKSWRWGDYYLDLHITKAELTAAIAAPAGTETYSTEQTFDVSATLENPGLETATDVTATIAISPAESAQVAVWPPGPLQSLDPGDIMTVTWTLTCTAPGETEITVMPDGETPDGRWPPGGTIGIPAGNLIKSSVTITQELKAHLVADITSPDEGEDFSVYDVFAVTATISNTGEADAEDVIATLEWEGGAELGVGETITKSIGVITGTAETGGVQMSATVSWTLVCTSTEDVTITVAPAGVDENTGVAIAADNLEDDSVTINQFLGPHLVVDITAPVEPVTVTTPARFEVAAVVSNTGTVDAEGVVLTLTVTGDAKLVQGETADRSIGFLSAGGVSSVVTWTLRCWGDVDAAITVTPGGTDVSTGGAIPGTDLVADDVTVYQEPGYVLRLIIVARNYVP